MAVFRYIEGFYYRRRHEALGRIAPAEFRRRWEQAHGLVGAGASAGRADGVLGISAASLDAG